MSRVILAYTVGLFTGGDAEIKLNGPSGTTPSSLRVLSGAGMSDGAWIGLNTGVNTSTTPAGAIGALNFHTTGTDGFGFFRYGTVPATGTIGFFSLMQLNDKGMFLNQGNMHFRDDNDASQRQVKGRATKGGLGIYSNSSLIDGSSSVEMFGHDHANFAGSVHYNSYNVNMATAPNGHVFQSYGLGSGGPVWNTQMVIKKDGKVVVSDNASTIAPTDRLTVKDNIGFESGDGERRLNGHTTKGSLGMYSNSSPTDGSTGIEVYGHDHGAGGGVSFAGSVHYNSYNGNMATAPNGHVFQSYGLGAGGAVWNTQMVIKKDGKVVVSDNAFSIAPTDRLTVKDNIGFESGDGERRVNGHTTKGTLGIYSNSSPIDGSTGIEMYGHDHGAGGGSIHYNSYAGGISPYSHLFQTYGLSTAGPVWTEQMVIKKDGKVAIGSGIIGNTPGDYKLYVEKGILTEHVKVALSATSYWADYVFNSDYNLMPISKVEEFVKKNKHLPDVPSAEEVVQDGIDLGNMDAKLLQKIEELTLYVIQQQKEINELKKQVGNKSNRQ